MTDFVVGSLGLAIGLALMLADLWSQGIGVALAGLVGPRLLRNPSWMAVTTLALAPVQIDLGGGITPVKLWAPLALAASVLASSRDGKWYVPEAAAVAPFLFFSVWGLAGESASASADPLALTVMLGATLVQLFMVWRAASQPGGLRNIAIGYAILLIALAISIPMMPAIAGDEGQRIRSAGLCGEPNWTGETAARLLPIALALVLDRGNARWLRVLGVVAVAAAVYTQFAAASRGGTLAMIAGMAAFALASANSTRSVVRGLVLLVGLVAALYYLAPDSFASRVLGSFGIGAYANEDHGDITSGRLALNAMAIEAFADAPLFGLGANGWYLRAMQQTGFGVAIHNGPLSGLVAFGLPAVVAYGVAQILGVVHFIRGLPLQGAGRIYFLAAFAHLVAVLVSSQSLSDIIRNLVWVAPALLVAGAHAARHTAGADEAPLSQGTRTAGTASPAPPTGFRLPIQSEWR